MNRNLKFYHTILVLFVFYFMNAGVSLETGCFYPDWVDRDLYYQISAQIQDSPDRDVGIWSGSGPWGGNIRSICIDPGNSGKVISACGFSMLTTHGGVWYSEDGGDNWQSSDLQGKPVYWVCSSPSETGVFWAGARYGVYRSDNGGINWDPAGLNSTFVIYLGVKHNDGNVIVAGVSGGNGIMVSTNGGSNWQQVGLNSGYMKGFATSAADPDLMYLTGSDMGSAVYLSSNGLDWNSLNLTGNAYGIWVDPEDAGRLFVAHENGVYYSDNGGIGWDNILPVGTVRAITAYDGNMYAAVNGAGIYESDDDGLNWELNSNGIVEMNWATAAADPDGAFFGFWGGIYHTDGPGQVYELAQTGLNASFVHALAYYEDRSELWAGTEGGGIYRSLDGGQTWEQKSLGLSSWTVYNLAPDDHYGYSVDRMLAATMDGIFVSDDFGENWNQLDLAGTQCTGVEIHPEDQDKIWIGGALGPVKYSDNGGESWITCQGLPFALYPRIKVGINPLQQLRVFLCFEQLATSVYYSDDNGLNFQSSSTLSGAQYHPFLSIRFPEDDLEQIIYCSTDNGVYKSVDYGQSFSQTMSSAFSWSCQGSRGTAVFSGTNDGVYCSMDEGGTWDVLNENITGLGIWGIVYGESDDQLFAASRGSGVKEYTFEQAVFNPPQNLEIDPVLARITWEEPEPRALAGYNIYLDDMIVPIAYTAELEYTITALLQNGETYLAGVSAVYDEPSGESQIIQQEFVYQGTAVEEQELSFSTGKLLIYPNPYRRGSGIGDDLRISYFLPQASSAELDIYNLKGQLVYRIIQYDSTTGEKSISWNGYDNRGKKLPGGLYLVQLKAGQTRFTGKFIIFN